MYQILRKGELGTQKVKLIHELALSNKIDFFPNYQRFGNIWSLSKKKLLIDTIINEFDIPKFYFNYFIEENNILNENNCIYAVIDGKQRLQAITDFLNDKFPLDKNFIHYGKPDIDISEQSFSQLRVNFPEIAASIENYTLDIVFVITDEEEKLEELFLRLNGGSPLNNAEKRNAIGGFLAKKIKEIVANNPFFTEKLKFKNPRFQHEDLLTRLILIEHSKSFISLTNKALESIIRTNKYENDLINDTLERLQENLNLLNECFNEKDIVLRAKGIIPIYYYFISRRKPNLEKIRAFIGEFEAVRRENRKLEESNPILIEFDRLNQQGAHQEKSLNARLTIFERYYEKFLENGQVTNETIIDVDKIDITPFDDDEEDGYIA